MPHTIVVPGLPPAVIAGNGALLSLDGLRRHLLWRVFDGTKPLLGYIMLNPSIADGTTDDPTIRVCVGRARRMGCGGIVVANLFDWRATNPSELTTHAVLPDGGNTNDRVILDVACIASLVICAWGDGGALHHRNDVVLGILRLSDIATTAIKLTKKGNPVHPPRQSYDLTPLPWPVV